MFDRKLRYLNALATEGNFSRAAAVCQISQPALSKAIRQLEAELNVKIVRRDPNFAGLTEQGELVLAWARRIIAETDSLYDVLLDSNKTSSGVLRLGILPVTFPLMSVFMPRFAKLQPNANLKVNSYEAAEIIKAFKNGDIDLAITYIGDFPSPAGRSHLLLEEEYELVVAKGSRLAKNKIVEWSDLRDIPLCLLPPKTRVVSPDVVEILRDVLRKTRHIQTTSILMVLDQIRTGEWATVLPKTIRITLANYDEIEAIPLPKTERTPSIGIVIPPREQSTPLAECFYLMATGSDTLRVLKTMMSRPEPERRPVGRRRLSVHRT